MSDPRDVLDLTGKGITVSSIDRPELWEEVIGLPIDYHPSFGWNVETRRTVGLGVAIAVQCAAVIARDIAKAGMALWRRERRQGMAGTVWVELMPNEHWFARMLARRPNDYQSWGDFWRLVVLQLKLTQDAYILKVRNRVGEVIALLPLQPARVRQLVSPTGKIFYEIFSATELERAQLGDERIVVPADSVIHILGRSINGVSGVSNFVLGDDVFNLVSAIATYQKTLFSGQGKSPVAFETDQQFEDTYHAAAYERLKRQLREAWDKGKPLLLEGGMKAKPLAESARDNMTVEALNRTIVQVCMFMEVPPHKIYAYESVKYDNQAHADNQYASDCLVPLADNIEEQFRNALFTDRELDTLWPEFDRKRMTASDAKSVIERVKVGASLGIMLKNEAREELGLNPVEGGDVFLQPVNTAQVDTDGNVLNQTAEGQPQGDGADQDEREERSLRLAIDNT